MAKRPRGLPAAFFLTDPKRTKHPERIAARLPRGWGVIYRHFGAKDRFRQGALIAAACRRRGLVLLVSADPELARVLRADGVHWPEQRLRHIRARHPLWIETASAHSRRFIARAAEAGVDAVLLSPIFPTKSSGAGAPLEPLRFARLAAGAQLPVYALGGVTAANAARATKHAAGWAAIDAVIDGWS